MKQLTVRMKADDVAEIMLYDVIGEDFFGGVSAKTFREAVKSVKAKTINLRINSPGGDVFEGAAMLATLDEWRGKKNKVEVDVDGLAASAASYVAMGGDKVRLGSNAMLMIHNPYAGVIGGSEDMRRMAETLDKIKDQILDAYERKSKAGREQLAAWMTAETWLTGQEAVDAGLADEVTEAVSVAALAEHGRVLPKMHYRHAPKLPDNHEAWEETRKRAAIAAQLAG